MGALIKHDYEAFTKILIEREQEGYNFKESCWMIEMELKTKVPVELFRKWLERNKIKKVTYTQKESIHDKKVARRYIY